MKESAIPRKYYKYTDYHLEPVGRRKLDFVVDEIQERFADQDPQQIKVLDFGCGKGNISLPLASLGYQVQGVDLDEKSVATVRARNSFPNAEFQVKNLLATEEKQNFDCIVASEVVEHLPDPDKFFAFAKRNLRPGGIVIATIPNGYSLEEIFRRFTTHTRIGRGIKKMFKNILLSKEKIIQTEADSPHLQFLTYRRLEGIASLAGFRATVKKNQSIWFRGMYYMGGRFIFKRGSSLFDSLDKADGQLAEVMPLGMGDGWMMTLERKNNKS